MTQHTPGTWRVEPIEGEPASFEIVSDDCETHPIATIEGNTSCRPVEEWRANADLLAASKDMLTALDHLIRWASVHGPVPNHRAWREAIAAVRLARAGKS